MKKILFIASLFLLFSCLPKQQIIPPTISVSPADSVLCISAITKVTYHIKGRGDEDLTAFKITTKPYIFYKDTTYGVFTHSMEYVATISIPDNLPELGADSLIAVTFTLSDAFNDAKAVRYLRVVPGYGSVLTDSTTMCYNSDSAFFFSFENNRLYKYSEISATDTNFDLVMMYNSSDGFVFASPDAYYVSQKISDIGLSYSGSGRIKTIMNKSTIDFSDVDARFLYNLTVSGSYINDDGNLGNGVAGLKAGNVVAFETHAKKKGIIKITNIDANLKTLSFKYAIQK